MFDFLFKQKSGLIIFAEKELDLIGMTADSKDKLTRQLRKHILKLIHVFSQADHTGSTAGITASFLRNLLKFEPLSPLKGDADEWVEVSENLWQNIRCSRVFRDEKGEAWDIQGKVFVDSRGIGFTSKDSLVKISFPYVPKTEYIEVQQNQ